MNVILLVFALSLFWAGVTGTFTLPNLLLGAGIAVIAVVFLRAHLARPRALRRLVLGARLAVYLLGEIVLSALRVALAVLDPRLKQRLRPAFVVVPVDLKTEAGIALLANMVTLTPGTLSADISEDGRSLLVHALTMEDEAALIASIKTGFEARIREVLADDDGR